MAFLSFIPSFALAAMLTIFYIVNLVNFAFKSSDVNVEKDIIINEIAFIDQSFLSKKSASYSDFKNINKTKFYKFSFDQCYENNLERVFKLLLPNKYTFYLFSIRESSYFNSLFSRPPPFNLL